MGKLRELSGTERRSGATEDVQVGPYRPRISNSSSDRSIQRVGTLQGIRRKIRLEHKALATEEAYVGWVKRFMEEHHLRTIASFEKIRSQQIEDFLTRLAVDDSVAAGTLDQAFYAIRYLYEHVLSGMWGRFEPCEARSQNDCRCNESRRNDAFAVAIGWSRLVDRPVAIRMRNEA